MSYQTDPSVKEKALAQVAKELIAEAKELGKSLNETKDPLVKRQVLAEELGQSLTTIWRWTRDGLLPKPVRLGKTVGWPRSVLNDWKVEKGWPAPKQAEEIK